MKHNGPAIGLGGAICVLALLANAQVPAKRAITVKDLLAVHRLSGPQISPDSKRVAYDVATPDYSANRLSHDVWIVPTSGGEARQLTENGSSQRPRWSPDGQHILVLSSDKSTTQIYSIRVDGGERARITSLSTGADNEIWSPDSKWIAFTSRVYPDCRDDACNSARDLAAERSQVKAQVAEKLLYRHWNAWQDGKRSHLFVVGAAGGVPRDLTPGADYDVPPFNLGEPEAVAFSPDSQQLCFTANTDKEQATSTNGDLFTVPISGGSEPKRITTNPADDWGPIYSPDGKWIAYRAQMLAGYESDRWRLMLYDRGTDQVINRTENFDASVEAFAWSPDSKTIYFQTQEKFELPIYSLSAVGPDAPKPVLSTGANEEFAISPDGRTIVFARSSLAMPAEIFAANSDGTSVHQLTHQNSALLSELDLPTPEFFWFSGAGGTQVEALLLKPPQFEASKKWPLLLLVHGGPQVEWDDAWSYRWNPQVMAAPGYAVLMVNPRGSPGYGSRFEQEISRDWGGKVYEDLMKAVDAALAKYPFLDSSHMAAAGGSYGGYMVNWIATHTGRFKCLISHAGDWNEVSSYGSTEELWFMDWEFGGSPWLHPELYKKWSPHEYAGALGKYKTPTLVIAGELDYRVPYTQSLEFFTALQREGVPSKLVIFPDEGHWILKPQNSEFWYSTFLGWLRTYLK